MQCSKLVLIISVLLVGCPDNRESSETNSEHDISNNISTEREEMRRRLQIELHGKVDRIVKLVDRRENLYRADADIKGRTMQDAYLADLYLNQLSLYMDMRINELSTMIEEIENQTTTDRATDIELENKR